VSNPNCLSHWYPRLLEAGVPVPRTIIVRAPMDLTCLCDGELPKPVDAYRNFLADLAINGHALGYPVFLRTGQGSGKHDWKRTCCIEKPSDFAHAVPSIVEWSNIVDICGLPTDVWCLREWIPGKSAFIAFNGMPVRRERRYFIRDGKVQCHHPYWPPDSIQRPSCPEWERKLGNLQKESGQEIGDLTALSLKVAAVMPGAWSVDWLWSDGRGWFCIDMAVAEQSFHWPGCPHNPKEEAA
jgi:hypothetical protein